MAHTPSTVIDAVVVDETQHFTLMQLVRVCSTEPGQLVALVDEGVLSPQGDAPERWRFSGSELARARKALRLSRDLELGPAGTALVLQLLDEIDALRRQLDRLSPP
jgi:chaperone modulatory protein CbpM